MFVTLLPLRLFCFGMRISIPLFLVGKLVEDPLIAANSSISTIPAVVHPGKPGKAEQALKRAEECLGNRNQFSLFLVTAGV